MKKFENCKIKQKLLQPNKYKTDLYFLQIFQSNMSFCLIISVFCKSCETICEPEITLVLYHLENLQKSKQNNFTFSVQFTNLTKRGYEHRHALEILKKIWIWLAFMYIAVQKWFHPIVGGESQLRGPLRITTPTSRRYPHKFEAASPRCNIYAT